MKQRGSGRLWTAAIVALLTAAMVGPAGAAEGQPWRHGILKAKSDAGIVLMPSRGGFAEKQGLKLETVELKSDALAMRALLAGDLDSFEGGAASGIIAASHGADVKTIGCYWTTLAHGVFVRPTVATGADLKGKTIAISAPGAMPDVVAHAVLEKYGVPATAVRFANLGGDLDRYKALVAGVADAAIVSLEYTPLAKSENIRLLVPAREVAPNFMRLCIFATARTLKARPKDAVRFLAAEMQGLRYALSHRDAALALSREVTHAKPDDPRPAYIFDDAVKHRAVDPDLPIPVDKLKWTEDLLVKTGNVTQPVDIAKVVDVGVRKKALALAGK
jgi:NitT/TauT family transport system substrate-binding protein